MTTKEKTKEIIDNQPDDATYEGIVRELAFSGMIERGLKDVRNERVISMKKWENESGYGSRNKMDGRGCHMA